MNFDVLIFRRNRISELFLPSNIDIIKHIHDKMVEPIFDYQFRLILIGDSTVGKSSLLKYFTDGKFAEVRCRRVKCQYYYYCCCCIIQSACFVALRLTSGVG